MHPDIMEKYVPEAKIDDENNLINLIKQDKKLKYIYDAETFILKVDNNEYKLQSQILRKAREIVYITEDIDVKIYIKSNLLDEESLYPQNNSLYIMLLSGDLITYGMREEQNKSILCHIRFIKMY